MSTEKLRAARLSVLKVEQTEDKFMVRFNVFYILSKRRSISFSFRYWLFERLNMFRPMHAGQYVSGRFCDFEVGVCRLVNASWQSEQPCYYTHPFIYTFLSVIYCKSNGIIARSRTLARSCGPLGYRGPRRVSFIRRNVQYYFPLILPVKREKKSLALRKKQLERTL